MHLLCCTSSRRSNSIGKVPLAAASFGLENTGNCVQSEVVRCMRHGGQRRRFREIPDPPVQRSRGRYTRHLQPIDTWVCEMNNGKQHIRDHHDARIPSTAADSRQSPEQQGENIATEYDFFEHRPKRQQKFSVVAQSYPFAGNACNPGNRHSGNWAARYRECSDPSCNGSPASMFESEVIESIQVCPSE